MDFNQALVDYVKTRGHNGTDARFNEVSYTWAVQGLNVSGRFFYLPFKNGQPTIDEFIDFIYWKVVKFCIPNDVILEYRQKYIATNDERYTIELQDKAKNLFIRAKNMQNITGEPAELILFTILEAILGAPQIACKMYLKTNSNMPVHGSDGIHVSFDNNTSMLQLYWGESKLYQELSSALNEVCDSVKHFITDDGTGAPRERDLEIIKDHISISDPKLKEELIKFFDPYETRSNNVQDKFACFVGFNSSLLSNLQQFDKTRFIQDFEEQYLKRIVSACKLFEKKINAENLQDLHFIFFLLPFEDVNQIRQKFLSKLGVAL